MATSPRRPGRGQPAEATAQPALLGALAFAFSPDGVVPSEMSSQMGTVSMHGSVDGWVDGAWDVVLQSLPSRLIFFSPIFTFVSLFMSFFTFVYFPPNL